MTAATPNDSGAAASRDAARTARRLTDGTLPRRVAPPGPGPGPTPAEGVAPPPAPVAAAAVSVRPGTHPVPTAAAHPLPAEPAAAAPTDPPQAPREAGAPSARPPAEATPARTAPGAPAPAGPPAEPLLSTPATDPPPTGAGPAPAPAPTVTGTPAPNPHGATGRPRPSTPTTTPPPAPAGPSPAPAGSSPALAGPAPASAGPSSAPSGTAPAPAGSSPASAGSSPAPSGPSSAPSGTAPASAGSSPAPARPSPAPAGPPGEPHPPAAVTAPTAPAAPAAPTAPAGPRPAPGGPARAAGAEAPRPDVAGVRAAGHGSAPTAASAPAPATRGGVFKGEWDVLDFGRITGARVASVAVPVAAVGRLPRRKNVIGAETTGSIPVHLLFRDGGAADAPASATGPAPAPAQGADADDDGGPDTVAMPAPARGAKAVIPRPVTKQVPARPASARPAPTADPALVERAAAVLPGWFGVAGGLLALAGCAAVVWWAGAVPAEFARMLRLPPRPYHGIHLPQWGLLALGVLALLFAVGGLGRGRVGYAWVLTLFGEYRGTVRRTGLVWASPLLLRRRVDVRLRHWRSEPLPAVDAKGTALDVTVLVVWRVRDTVRAALGVDGHEDYLREQVEAAMARVLSQLPADAFHEDAPTLRDAEAVGEALTRLLSAECAPVGLDVFSAQPTRIEYAPEVAEAMRRRRIAAIDAKHRDSVLTSVVDAVDDVVHRLTSRGLVELDDYERKALVKDLTVAFYTGRGGQGEGA
ncbi:SPFH domain-containing protein [Streptomyces sp. NPDC085466]|uniref:SPFH domain-containing protein n=1 Tax=Streptomyces sp. NPDC085466 TaxID=3365725 RepID=UPI0037CCF249